MALDWTLGINARLCLGGLIHPSGWPTKGSGGGGWGKLRERTSTCTRREMPPPSRWSGSSEPPPTGRVRSAGGQQRSSRSLVPRLPRARLAQSQSQAEERPAPLWGLVGSHPSRETPWMPCGAGWLQQTDLDRWTGCRFPESEHFMPVSGTAAAAAAGAWGDQGS